MVSLFHPRLRVVHPLDSFYQHDPTILNSMYSRHQVLSQKNNIIE